MLRYHHANYDTVISDTAHTQPTLLSLEILKMMGGLLMDRLDMEGSGGKTGSRGLHRSTCVGRRLSQGPLQVPVMH